LLSIDRRLESLVPDPEHAPQQTATDSNPPPPAQSQNPPATEPGAASASVHPASDPAAADVIADEPLTPELVEEEAIRADFVLRWAVVLLAFLLGSTRISETSALVHIKTGQYLASNGVLPPAHDVFSYTAEGRPWTNLAWGFDLLFAGIHALTSFAGVSAFKALVVGGVFWLIGRISRPGIPTWWGSVCGAAALLGCHLRIAADPILITYLGLAIVLTLLHYWRAGASGAGRSKLLWLLVPVVVVWSNLDPRAWLGLALVALFAAGDLLGAFLKSPTALTAASRRELWFVFGVSVASTVIHPFGWKSLAAPWYTYAVEYPAFRDYISEAYLGRSTLPFGIGLNYFPMYTPTFADQVLPQWTWDFWRKLDIAALSAVAVLLAAAASFVVNRARHDWGHLAVYLGFVLLAVVCLHELPAAAIVACVLATLNGQAWYAATCRQTYSVERRDVLLSQGGRALTVVVFAGIAFFGGTGRMRDSTGAPARTGYGLDRNLEIQLEDLRQQLSGDASFDDRPFNTHLTQGDQLIWVGQKVFADSRVGVYYAADDADNLLVQHLLTRDALSAARRRESGSDTSFATADKSFVKYGITHVVCRLTSFADYELFFDLVLDVRRWSWTSLGASAAIFYRNDARNPRPLADFIAAHQIDFRKEAFAGAIAGGDLVSAGARTRGIRRPSFYQKYFWTRRRDSSADIRTARHLARLTVFPSLPQYLNDSRLAMAYLTIRRAQVGLNLDPDDVNGYLALGSAYNFLAQIESVAAINGSRHPRNGMRYLQTVSAFNQALVGDPENREAHAELVRIYEEARKPDLVLQHMQALQEILSADPDTNLDVLDAIDAQVARKRRELESINEMVTARAAEGGPLRLIQGYLQNQCVLKTLAEIEQAGSVLTGDLGLEQLRIALLIETGRSEEAFEAAGRFAEAAEQARLPDSVEVVALASLTYGDYEGAASRWTGAADQAENLSLNALLQNLAPHVSNYPWPLNTTRAFFDALYQRPESIASLRMSVALVRLEEGQLELARELFRSVLTTSPDTLNRPLVAFYLRQLSDEKEEIDLWSPSDRVAELFEPEPDE
jgi:tetratricopeptide (TPR) repeat protein